MKKVSTTAVKQSKKIWRQKLTSDWTWAIARVGIACWTKWGNGWSRN